MKSPNKGSLLFVREWSIFFYEEMTNFKGDAKNESN